jgi:hypothetical protein
MENSTVHSFQFRKPSFTTTNTNGVKESYYIFTIDTENGISTSIIENVDLTKETIYNELTTLIANNSEWYYTYISEFINASQQYFAKKYTVNVLIKHIVHSLKEIDLELPDTPFIKLTFIPDQIHIKKGKFIQLWNCKAESAQIDIDIEDENVNIDTEARPSIPVLENSEETSNTPESQPNCLESIDDIPIDETSANEITVMEMGSGISKEQLFRHYEKQRVKEARIRAKLAQYKADRVYTEFISKYGSSVSDSETDSDSSYTSDNE